MECSEYFYIEAGVGIQETQESRGLGDVYKRELLTAYELPVDCLFTAY